MEQPTLEFKQKIGYARGSLWAPFHTVGMVARIKGEVSPSEVEEMQRKLLTLYPPLGCRVHLDREGAAWLTTAGTDALPLEVRLGQSREDYGKLFLEQERIPFNYDRGPLARFFLLRGEGFSDIVIITPHVICDGTSMTLVIADVVALLNDPAREVRQPAPLPPVTWESVPHSPGDFWLLRCAVRLGNRLFARTFRALSQKQYQDVNQSYWQGRHPAMLVAQLTLDDTAAVIRRCREHGISVTGALVAAFRLAQRDLRPSRLPDLKNVTVAANIRNRIAADPGRVVGVYASNMDMNVPCKAGTGFWQLASRVHQKVHRVLNARAPLLWPLAIGELDPRITDSLLASLLTGELERKLGPLSSLLKIGGVFPRLDVSNIGRFDFSETGCAYPLESYFPLPPFAPGGGVALNVLTINGQMNMFIKYSLAQMDEAEASALRDRAIQYLIAEESLS